MYMYYGWSGAEDAEPVIQIPVGLPCLERGRLVKKIANMEPIYIAIKLLKKKYSYYQNDSKSDVLYLF